MYKPLKPPKVLVSIGLFALGSSIAVAAAPGSEPQAKPDSTAKRATVAAAAAGDVTVPFAGMSIAIDPETGRMKQPTPEQAAELSSAMRKMFAQPAATARTAGSKVTRHPNGMLSAVVAPEHLSFSVMRRNSDGTVARQCVSSPRAAEAFLQGAADFKRATR